MTNFRLAVQLEPTLVKFHSHISSGSSGASPVSWDSDSSQILFISMTNKHPNEIFRTLYWRVCLCFPGRVCYRFQIIFTSISIPRQRCRLPRFPACLSDQLPSLIRTPNNPTARLSLLRKLSLPPNEFLPLVISGLCNNLLLSLRKPATSPVHSNCCFMFH